MLWLTMFWHVFQLRKAWILDDMNLGWHFIDFPNQYPKSCQISAMIFYPKKLMILSCHKLMRLESQTQIKLLNCRSKCITASSLSLIEDNLQTMCHTVSSAQELARDWLTDCSETVLGWILFKGVKSTSFSRKFYW